MSKGYFGLNPLGIHQCYKVDCSGGDTAGKPKFGGLNSTIMTWPKFRFQSICTLSTEFPVGNGQRSMKRGSHNRSSKIPLSATGAITAAKIMIQMVSMIIEINEL